MKAKPRKRDRGSRPRIVSQRSTLALFPRTRAVPAGWACPLSTGDAVSHQGYFLLLFMDIYLIVGTYWSGPDRTRLRHCLALSLDTMIVKSWLRNIGAQS